MFQDVIQRGSLQMDGFFKFSIIRDISEVASVAVSSNNSPLSGSPLPSPLLARRSRLAKHSYLLGRREMAGSTFVSLGSLQHYVQVKITYYGGSFLKRAEKRTQKR